jgi:hypothetical protein
MGSELSCPCGSRTNFEEPKESSDKKFLLEEEARLLISDSDILFSCIDEDTKICLIRPSKFEAFFKRIKFFRVEKDNKREDLFYNTVFLSNFVYEDKPCAFICLHYSDWKKNDSSYFTHTYDTKKKYYQVGYNTNYKVVEFNFVSKDKDRLCEQLLNDLNRNLTTGYMFFGIINDLENKKDDYGVIPKKILYKGSMKIDLEKVIYTIDTHQGNLSQAAIESIIKKSSNRKKNLKAIIVDGNNKKNQYESLNKTQIEFEKSPTKNGVDKRCFTNRSFMSYNGNVYNESSDRIYFFIYEHVKDEECDLVYEIVELQQNNVSETSFLEDIAAKFKFSSNFKVNCIVNDDKRTFIILSAESRVLTEITPDDDDELDTTPA